MCEVHVVIKMMVKKLCLFKFVLFSYFHKIPEEVPELELKATHGLASPQEFTLPAPHAMWAGDTYTGFDASKAHPPQPVSHLYVAF